MKLNKQFYVIIALLICLFSLSGCTTVSFVKGIDRTMKNLDHLNDQLQVAKKNTDSVAFEELLDEMKSEADKLVDLDPGLLKGKGSKDVREKGNAIAELVTEIKQESEKSAPDDEKVDELMDDLTSEIDEAVE